MEAFAELTPNTGILNAFRYGELGLTIPAQSLLPRLHDAITGSDGHGAVHGAKPALLAEVANAQGMVHVTVMASPNKPE